MPPARVAMATLRTSPSARTSEARRWEQCHSPTTARRSLREGGADRDSQEPGADDVRCAGVILPTTSKRRSARSTQPASGRAKSALTATARSL